MEKVIYKITNKINKKIYIGSAIKFNVRKNQHIHHLRKKTHHNIILQNHVNKYGIDSINFEIIERNCENLIEREQYYIDKLNPEINIHRIAQSPKGLKRTPEQIKNMINGRLRNSGYKKGYKRPKEVVERIRETRLKNGGYIVTENMKKEISKKNKGRKISNKTKKKISKSLKGAEFSKEHKKKLSEAAKGNTNWKNIDYNNIERNKKISYSMKKRMSKKVINTETGEIYDSAKEAAESYGMPASTFTKHISGYNKKNKTPFKYV